MVASKIDIANKDKLAKLKRYCKKRKLELFPISAVTGKGIEELKYAMAEAVRQARTQPQEDPLGEHSPEPVT
jgi:GTPase